jgi:hypothetical protein
MQVIVLRHFDWWATEIIPIAGATSSKGASADGARLGCYELFVDNDQAALRQARKGGKKKRNRQIVRGRKKKEKKKKVGSSNTSESNANEPCNIAQSNCFQALASQAPRASVRFSRDNVQTRTRESPRRGRRGTTVPCHTITRLDAGLGRLLSFTAGTRHALLANQMLDASGREGGMRRSQARANTR